LILKKQPILPMKKKFDAVKMTREIREKLSELYFSDREEFYRRMKIADEDLKQIIKRKTKSKKVKS